MKYGKFISTAFGILLSTIPCLAECPLGDATGDCSVDPADFAVFISQWLTGNPLPSDMVPIPSGTFQMGDSLKEGLTDEFPVHTVTLDSFAMGKYEITFAQYCAFLNMAYPAQIKVWNRVVYAVSDTGYQFPYCSLFYSTSYEPYTQIDFSNNTFLVRSKNGRDMTQDPMVYVTWYGAIAYCNWRSQQEGRESCYDLSAWACDFTKNGYRLATEAEWEYAARGGLSGNRLPWGNTITHSQANYFSKNTYSYDISPTRGYHPTWNDGIFPYTSPVGSFAPNGFGLYEMAGNVWELCNDRYNETYYSISPDTNPKGPTTGSRRVLRGGGWRNAVFNCRVSFRCSIDPWDKGNDFGGFRVVLARISDPLKCPSMDFTGDCFEDLEDFAIFASQWLTHSNP